jgi:hypothetical protein
MLHGIFTPTRRPTLSDFRRKWDDPQTVDGVVVIYDDTKSVIPDELKIGTTVIFELLKEDEDSTWYFEEHAMDIIYEQLMPFGLLAGQVKFHLDDATHEAIEKL